MKHALIWGTVTLGGIVMFFACMGATLPLEVAIRMLLGWTFFLGTVAPETRIDWPNAAFAMALVFAFALGLHWFLRWFYAAIKTKDHTAERDSEFPSVAMPSVAWSWRWTTAITLTLLFMFVAGISMVGITHQVAWLCNSDEPLLILPAPARVYSKHRLKHLVLAAQGYDNTYQLFPSGATSDGRGQLLHGWQTALLPFFERQELFDQIDQRRPWNDPKNLEHFKTRVPNFQDPRLRAPRHQSTAEGYSLTHYAGNRHVLGPDISLTYDDVTDGVSNTIMVGEAAGNYRPWGSPTNWRDPALGIGTSPAGFGGPNPKRGTHFAMCDGSVVMLSKDTDPRVLKALSTPRGGEEVPPLP